MTTKKVLEPVPSVKKDTKPKVEAPKPTNLELAIAELQAAGLGFSAAMIAELAKR